ncbi:hypothetical protein H0H93_000240 [Arthromyces matolae]|nr:hypothetical protein H0H93_000240 [Arthromyces matolae]
MGRRRLYHTAEEARLAANAKSRKSYHKNKSTIRMRRQDDYQSRKEERLSQMRPRPQFGPKPAVASATQGDVTDTGLLAERDNPDHVFYWTRRIEKVNKRFIQEVGTSPLAFVEKLYSDYLATGNNEPILVATICNEKLQKGLAACMHKVLQLAGCSDEYHRGQEVSNRITAMGKALEDLGLHTTFSEQEGMPDFKTLHDRKEFLFQTLLTS